MTRLLTISEAAEALGYSVNSVRRIVDRSRRRARGERVSGPTIKFFQATRSSQILFRERWVLDFIDACTVDPEVDRTREPVGNAPQRANADVPPSSGLDAQLFEL